MARNECKRHYLVCREFSCGPLHWRSTSLHAAEQLDGESANALQIFGERLQSLINQALSEGCTYPELNKILGRHTRGDHHVDA